MTGLTATRPLVDAEQDELAYLDAGFRRAFGSDMRTWDVETLRLYEDGIADIYARYPKAVS
jgi:hypothetical protein